MRSGCGTPVVVEQEVSAETHLRGGRVLSPSLLRCAFSRVLEMPHLPELLEALILGGPSGGCLQQWPLPKELAHGTTYAELVELFARTHAAIPLGLIRRTGRSHPSERHSVLAAPPPSTVLMLHDRVFVLSPGNDPVPARI